MFTTFTGNTRRPRQVNLGGKKTSALGIGRAQQERVQRQRERDMLNAARQIQRIWRGHAARQTIDEEMRKEWDVVESVASEKYNSEEESLSQLLRLLRFASWRKEEDVSRLQHYVRRHKKTVEALGLSSSGPWPSAYLRLEKMLLSVLQHELQSDMLSWSHIASLLEFVCFVARQIPADTSRNAQQYYRILASVLSSMASLPVMDHDSSESWSIILAAIVVPLKHVTAFTLDAYEAFGCIFLTLPLLSADSMPLPVRAFRDALADAVNYKLLASALASLFKNARMQTYPELKTSMSRVRLLGSFIFLHRYAHNFRTPEAYAVHKDFVAVVSSLLDSLPLTILTGVHPGNKALDHDEMDQSSQCASDFSKEQLFSLLHQEGIGSLLAGSSQPLETSREDKSEEARQFANYALALLRFFPNRGDEIRMWLYIGPSRSISTASIPRASALQYFWEASKRSSIFTKILQDSRAAISLLKLRLIDDDDDSDTNATSRPTQNGFWQSARQEADQNAAVTDEWRVILVFLELYTFVLKVTDDEEFFSTGQAHSESGQVRDHGLPLGEIKDLTTFLKNLGFTLYFNAAEITATDAIAANASARMSFYDSLSVDTHSQKKAVEPSVKLVAGFKIDHVKGLVTGLLRMIYERDSRRKFLPSDHWLMTSRFDLTGFIPAVVEEEESRHNVEEQDADDVDVEEDDVDNTPQLIGTSRSQQQRRIERLQRQQRKASRRRYLQAVAPRLEILQNMPFLIPFVTRVQIFREFVHLDMSKRRGTSDPDAWRFRVMHHPDPDRRFDKHAANIRRENEFEDAFEQFYPLGQGLKEPIQITFMDKFGAPEAGIDGGGVTKEFLTSVTNRAFMPTDYIDMFVENDQHLLYPNPAAVEEFKESFKQAGLRENSPEFRIQVSQLLQRYEFLGRIIGKCLYEGILVDVNFAPFFLRKWALTGGAGSAPNESGYRPTLNDVRDLDEELYQGLYKLKTYAGDVEDFSLNFTVTDNVVVDHSSKPKKTKSITKELKADGANSPVTNRNRLVYISYMARHRLQNQPYLQTTAFLRGLSTMVQPSWLSMFNQSELQILIGGTSTSIDIDDLRGNTLYGGTYVIGDDGLEHPTIMLFWKVMKSLSDVEQRAVLRFITSTPRAPLLGFGTLNPKFSIRDAGSDQERLPSTSTCVNLLKLPMYAKEEVLRKKLLYSVFSGAGFDLS